MLLALIPADDDARLQALRLRQLNVTRLLLKPLKVRGMLEAISARCAPEPLPQA